MDFSLHNGKWGAEAGPAGLPYDPLIMSVIILFPPVYADLFMNSGPEQTLKYGPFNVWRAKQPDF
jgi:hypothetical protein